MKSGCLLAVIACLFVSGCGNYRLIGSMSGSDVKGLPDELQWKLEKEARLPQNDVEELAARVAADQQTVTHGNTMIVYVTGDQNEALVAAVEDISDQGSTAADRFSPKEVERYLIRSGRIYASMGPSIEPFPDVSFERAAISAARSALSAGGRSILVVLDLNPPLTLEGIAHSRCNVEIVGFKTESKGPGNAVFRKTVNHCRPD